MKGIRTRSLKGVPPGPAEGARLIVLTAGGLVVLALNHTLGATMDRVVLSGVAAMQLFSALTSFIVLTMADAETTRGVLFWLWGSLGGASWSDVALCTAVLVGVLVVCLTHTTTLDAFAFGEEAAANLGVRVARARVLLLSVTALLTAVLVSSVGRSASWVWPCRTRPVRSPAPVTPDSCPSRRCAEPCSWCGWTRSPAPCWTRRRSR